MSQELDRYPFRVKQDFPVRGVSFKDLTPWFMDREKFDQAIGTLASMIPQCEWIVGIEARGWVIGSVLADRLGVRFLPVRKGGSLPFVEVEARGRSEYAEFSYAIPELVDSLRGRAVVVDDVLATGCTAEAVGGMIKSCGFQIVGYAFFLVLEEFEGWQKLGPPPCFSALRVSKNGF